MYVLGTVSDWPHANRDVAQVNVPSITRPSFLVCDTESDPHWGWLAKLTLLRYTKITASLSLPAGRPQCRVMLAERLMLANQNSEVTTL